MRGAMAGWWLVAGWLLWFAPTARAEVNLSGEWSYQALNAGDTNFQVEHQGENLRLYRVLHPEYEGQTYKLEHIFRATLRGEEIRGDLYVREEGMPDFEKLRVFTGRVQAGDRMLVDEMPLRRVGPGPDSAAPPEPPKYSKVIIQRKTEPAEQVAEAPAGAAVAAPEAIPDLVPASLRIETGPEKQAGALLGEGDQAYEARRFEEAVDRYLEALKLDPQRVELLYKLGLGHALLADRAGKAGQVEPARLLYTQAIEAWRRAYKLDPYNWGTRENLRRAELKLGALR